MPSFSGSEVSERWRTIEIMRNPQLDLVCWICPVNNSKLLLLGGHNRGLVIDAKTFKVDKTIKMPHSICGKVRLHISGSCVQPGLVKAIAFHQAEAIIKRLSYDYELNKLAEEDT